jgi:hypothetical protein
MTVRARRGVCGALWLAVMMSGCVLSIDPVIPESGALLDERLIGNWEQASGGDLAVVSRGTGGTYLIEYTSDGRVSWFEARLGRLESDSSWMSGPLHLTASSTSTMPA